MKKSAIATLLAASVAAVSVPVVYAGYGDGEGCREGKMSMRHHEMGKKGPHGEMDREAGPERFYERMADRLDLSDEQKQSISAAMETSRDEMTALREKLDENRGAMRELTPADEDFISKSEALVSEKADLQKEIALIKVSERKAVYDVLNEEQREQLTAMNDRRHAHNGKGKPHRY